MHYGFKVYEYFNCKCAVTSGDVSDPRAERCTVYVSCLKNYDEKENNHIPPTTTLQRNSVVRLERRRLHLLLLPLPLLSPRLLDDLEGAVGADEADDAPVHAARLVRATG